MKSHTGIFMTIGKGGTYTASCKQKLNTKSSTEAELVAIDDAMAQVLWTRHFLAEQGVPVPVTTIYQDNKSTILLSENGRGSSSKRTKHLDVRYFFITDRIKRGEVKVAYCPTENMLADFFTKPLQGGAFKRMRSTILNMPSTDKVNEVHRSVLEETEKNDNDKRGGAEGAQANKIEWRRNKDNRKKRKKTRKKKKKKTKEIKLGRAELAHNLTIICVH